MRHYRYVRHLCLLKPLVPVVSLEDWFQVTTCHGIYYIIIITVLGRAIIIFHYYSN